MLADSKAARLEFQVSANIGQEIVAARVIGADI